MKRGLGLLWIPATLGLLACSGVENEEAEDPALDFSFEMASSVAISVDLTDEAGPVANAVVVVRVDPVDTEQPAAVVWTGLTDDSGHAEGAPTLAVDENRLALLVTKRGYRGPYSDESLREQLGPVAPAAWVQATAPELRSIALTLARNP